MARVVQTICLLVFIVTLTACGSGGKMKKRKWKIVSSPENSQTELVSDNTPFPVFKTNMEGSYEITLIVNDGVLISDPATNCAS